MFGERTHSSPHKPKYAICKLLERNKLTAKDIGAYEIHEAFAVYT